MTKRDRKLNFPVFGRLQHPEKALKVNPLWRGVNYQARMAGRQDGKFRSCVPAQKGHAKSSETRNRPRWFRLSKIEFEP